jgi:hypothetical protein
MHLEIKRVSTTVSSCFTNTHRWYSIQIHSKIWWHYLPLWWKRGWSSYSVWSWSVRMHFSRPTKKLSFFSNKKKQNHVQSHGTANLLNCHIFAWKNTNLHNQWTANNNNNNKKIIIYSIQDLHLPENTNIKSNRE